MTDIASVSDALDIIRRNGGAITPSDLLSRLVERGYSEAAAVEACQRLFDRNAVLLSENAMLEARKDRP